MNAGRRFLRALFVFACSAGLIDILATLYRSPSSFSGADTILPSLAITTFIAAVGFCLVHVVVVGLSVRVLSLEHAPTVVGNTCLWLILFTAGASLGFIPPSEWPGYLTGPTLWLVLLGMLTLVAVTTRGAYVFSNRYPDGTVRNIVTGLCISLPFLLVEFLALRMIRDGGTLSGMSVTGAVAGFFILMAVPTLAVLCWSPIQRHSNWLAGALFILLLASPLGLAVNRAAPNPIQQPGSQNGERIPHVVLLTIDTLRADSLSCYGNTRIQTPNIDAIAEDGVRFARVNSSSPWTLPAVISMMTGVAPAVHGTISRAETLPEQLRPISEHFRDAGYYTAAIGDNFHINRESQMGRGFLDYTWYPKPRLNRSFGGTVLKRLFPGQFAIDGSTPHLTRLARGFLDSNAERDFFLWLHYYDPHLPYEPPRRHVDGNPPTDKVGWALSIQVLNQMRGGLFLPTAEERAWFHKLYEAEVKYVDDHVGTVMTQLKDLGIYDDALIIVASDHGEEFWEHGDYEHGHTLYQEVIHVPLLIKLPQSRLRGVRRAAVGLQDVMPTVLDICGIPYDAESLSARTLLPLVRGETESWEEKPVVSSGLLYHEDQESVLFDDWKYIRHTVTPDTEELYNLNRDPDENANLILSNPSAAESARQVLTDRVAATARLKAHYGFGEDTVRELNEREIEEMRAIGYL